MSPIEAPGDAALSAPAVRRALGLVVDMAKYAGASVGALMLDYGVLMVCLKVLGLGYLTAAGLGFSSGLVLVYVLSVRYVFSDRRRLAPKQEFFGFLVTGVLGLALNQALMLVFVETAGLSAPLAKIPTAGLVFLFNFSARRALLFSTPGLKAP